MKKLGFKLCPLSDTSEILFSGFEHKTHPYVNEYRKQFK